MGLTAGLLLASANHCGAYVVLNDLDNNVMMYPTFAAAVSRQLTDSSVCKDLKPHEAGIHILLYVKICPPMSSPQSQVQAPVPVHEASGGPSVSSHEGTGGPSVSSRTGTSSPPKVQPPMSLPQSQIQAPVPVHEASGGPSVSSHEGTGGPSVSSCTGTSSPPVSCCDGTGSPSVSGMSNDLSGVFEMSASPGNMPLTSTPIASDFSHASSFESESTILSVKIPNVSQNCVYKPTKSVSVHLIKIMLNMIPNSICLAKVFFLWLNLHPDWRLMATKNPWCSSYQQETLQ